MCAPAPLEGRLVHHAPEQLRPHPVYVDVCGPIAKEETPHDPAESTPVIAPLLTTRDGLILDGHTRWQLTVRERQPSVACIEYDLTIEQAVLFMLDQHRGADRLNAFCPDRDGAATGTALACPGAGTPASGGH